MILGDKSKFNSTERFFLVLIKCVLRRKTKHKFQCFGVFMTLNPNPHKYIQDHANYITYSDFGAKINMKGLTSKGARIMKIRLPEWSLIAR